MCQVKVGSHLKKRHNAQNQIRQSDKDLNLEMLLINFDDGGIETLPENS